MNGRGIWSGADGFMMFSKDFWGSHPPHSKPDGWHLTNCWNLDHPSKVKISVWDLCFRAKTSLSPPLQASLKTPSRVLEGLSVTPREA